MLRRLEQKKKQLAQAKIVIRDLHVYAEKPELDWNQAQNILHDLMNEISDISEQLRKQSAKLEFARKVRSFRTLKIYSIVCYCVVHTSKLVSMILVEFGFD